jgi:hypothetical protein
LSIDILDDTGPDMQLTIQIPDDLIEPVKDQLPPPEMGVLEAIALDAVVGFLLKLDSSDTSS